MSFVAPSAAARPVRLERLANWMATTSAAQGAVDTDTESAAEEQVGQVLRVRIATLAGKHYFVNAQTSDLISHVKAQVCAAGGPEPAAQRLIYCGVECKDNQTLSEINFQNDSSFHLVKQSVSSSEPEQELKHQEDQQPEACSDVLPKVLIIQRRARIMLRASLKRKLAACQQDRTLCQAQLATCQQQNAELQDELVRERIATEDELSHVQQLQSDNAQLVAQLATCQQDKLLVDQQFKLLVDQQANSNSQLDEARQTSLQLQTENAQLRKELNIRLHSELDEYDEVRQNNLQLQKENTRLHSELDEYEVYSEQLLEDLETCRKDKQKLDCLYEEARQKEDTTQLSSMLHKLQEDNAKLALQLKEQGQALQQAELHRLQEDNAHLTLMLKEEVQTKRVMQQAELYRLQEENAKDLKKLSSVLEHQLQVAQAHHQELDTQLAAVQQHNVKLEHDKSELAAQLAACQDDKVQRAKSRGANLVRYKALLEGAEETIKDQEEQLALLRFRATWDLEEAKRSLKQEQSELKAAQAQQQELSAKLFAVQQHILQTEDDKKQLVAQLAACQDDNTRAQKQLAACQNDRTQALEQFEEVVGQLQVVRCVHDKDKTELSSVQQQNQKLQHDKNELVAQIAACQDDNTQLQHEKNDLVAQLAACQQDKLELCSASQLLQQETKHCKELVNVANEANKDLKKQLKLLQFRTTWDIGVSTRSLQQEQLELKARQAQQQELIATLAAVQQHKLQLEDDKKQLVAQLAASQDDNTQALKQLDEVSCQFQVVKCLHVKDMTELSSVQQQNQKLQHEQNDLVAQLAACQQDKLKKLCEIHVLEQECKELLSVANEANKDLKKQLTLLQLSLQQEQTELKASRAQQQELTAELSAVQQHNLQLEDDKKQLVAQLTDCQADNVTLRQESEELQKDFQSTNQSSTRHYEKLLQDYSANLSLRNVELNELKEQLRKLTRTADTLTHDNANLSYSIDLLDQQTLRLQGSNDWLEQEKAKLVQDKAAAVQDKAVLEQEMSEVKQLNLQLAAQVEAQETRFCSVVQRLRALHDEILRVCNFGKAQHAAVMCRRIAQSDTECDASKQHW